MLLKIRVGRVGCLERDMQNNQFSDTIATHYDHRDATTSSTKNQLLKNTTWILGFFNGFFDFVVFFDFLDSLGILWIQTVFRWIRIGI